MNMIGKREATCCFTGHRPDKLPWRDDEGAADCLALKERIAQSLDGLYRRGFRHFITGMALGSDLYFAEAALALRDLREDVTVEAAIPCPTQCRGWSAPEQARYRAILDRCNLETMVQQHYTQGCMLRRNRYMVERSALLLAVYNGSSRGGTRYTINYAMDSGLEIIMLNV